MKIILGGGGSSTQYTSSGDFQSRILDMGSTTAFNRIDFTFDKPSQTNMQFQIASFNAVNGSCTGATYNYIGPDGTTGTYFTSPTGGIPFITNLTYQNPGRCFRYKAYFTTTDTSQTPVFYDATINYSP